MILNIHDIKAASWKAIKTPQTDEESPLPRGEPAPASAEWSNWIIHRKWKYSVCCLIEHFLFVPIFLLWYLSKSMSNTVYFNFRCKIQLYHPVLQPKNTVLSPTTNSLLALWPRRPGVVHVCAVKKGVEEIRSSDLGMGSTLIGDGSRFIRR